MKHLILTLTGTPLPKDRAIDGMDISALLTGDAKSVGNEFLYYSRNGRIDGMREGNWKLLVRHPERQGRPDPAAKAEVTLFNPATDLGEKGDRSAANATKTMKD